MYKKLTFLLLLVAQFAWANADSNWNLDKDDDGIKVYTRNIANSKVKAIKVECYLDATPSQLVSVIMDINNEDGWVYHATESHVVKQVSPAEVYYYSLVKVPWPVKNRDFIAHIKVSQNPATKVIIVDAPCVADMVPRKSGIVRIEESTGQWIITPADGGRLKVSYTLHSDPGGDVPAWLTNMFIAQGPMESFKKLKVQLQKPVYKNAKLSYIVD